jgi:hypothetical protein
MELTRRTAIYIASALVAHVACSAVVSGMLAAASADRAADSRTADLRAGCERGNAQRLTLYHNTIRDARARRAAATQFTGHARRVLARLSRKGFEDARAVVTAFAAVAVRPGSVVANCQIAYP